LAAARQDLGKDLHRAVADLLPEKVISVRDGSR
jgi:hypothetical protein